MKAIAIAALVLVAGCGVKGPPERPSGAKVERGLADRTIIRGTSSVEAPASPVAAPKRERRFILDGLL